MDTKWKTEVTSFDKDGSHQNMEWIIHGDFFLKGISRLNMCLQIKDVIVKYYIKNKNSETNREDFKNLSSFIYPQIWKVSSSVFFL